MQGRDEHAKQSLLKLRGRSFNGRGQLLEEEYLEMQRGIADELDSKENESKDIFKGTELGRTLICFGIVSHIHLQGSCSLLDMG
jgi:hypothetical protein